MTAPDPRITDPGVKAARRAEWLRPENWVSEDPNPEYSRLDRLDGLGPLSADVPLPRPVRADSLRTLEPVLPEQHSMYAPMRVIFWMVAIGVPTFVVFAIGFMVGGRFA